MPIVGCEADAVAFEEVESHTLRALPAAVGEAKTVRSFTFCHLKSLPFPAAGLQG